MRLLDKPRVRSIFVIMPSFLVAFSVAAYFHTANFADAAGAPEIVGGSAIVGNTDTFLPVNGVQVQGDVVGTVPINLKVDSGTLKLGTTTGLTFTGPTTGRSLTFTGTKSAVNAALATLVYRSNSPAAVTFTASIGSAGMVYYPGNGHVYEVVSPENPIDWQEANTLAQARTFNGAPGYLATITDQDENDYITARMSGDGWFGASDANSEGNWEWVTGPEAGMQFWTGLGNGSSVDGAFSNWADGEPNNAGDEDCAQFYGSGSGWNDLPCGGGTTLGSYVVEYGTDDNLPTAPSSTSFTITTSTPAPETVSVSSCAAFFSELVDKNDHRYDTVNLTQNLDCTGYNLTALFSEYDDDAEQPLGFEGTFNGNGHTISNLTVAPRYDANTDYRSPAGLFAFVNGATITNVSFANLEVTGDNCVGGIVGYADALTLSGVTVNGMIGGDQDTNDQVGGLVGCLYEYSGNSSLTNSSFSGSVIANGSGVGGSVGQIQANSGNTVSLSTLQNTGTISGGSNRIAGIVGEVGLNGGDLLIENSTTVGVTADNSGDVAGIIGTAYVNGASELIVRNNIVTGDVTAEGNAAGIIGLAELYSDDARILISNSTISHDITSTDSRAGGVAGYIEVASYGVQILTIEDITVTAAVHGGAQTGGLVGQLDGYTEDDSVNAALVNRSRTTGAVTTDNANSAGGLVGQARQTNFTKSYATGSINAGTGSNAGGIVGQATAVTILDSYARGSVNASSNAGGLVGNASNAVTVARSYSTGDVDSSSNHGGLVGSGSATVDGAYWDTQTSGQTNSVGGDAKTTAEMMQLSTYVDWNFTTTWAKSNAVNDGYPCLRWTGDCEHDLDSDGISAAIESAAPNNGDGNYDGQPDAEQSNVASLVNGVTGKYLTLEINDTCSLSNVTVVAAGSISKQDGGYQYSNGLLNFNAICGDPGVTITVKQYYHGVTSVDGLVARKFNPNTLEYKTVTGHDLLLGIQSLGGQDVAILTYAVTDGDDLDTDGTVDGTIIDPIGLANAAGSGSAPNTGFFAQAISSGAVASIGVTVLIVAGAASITFGITRTLRRANRR